MARWTQEVAGFKRRRPFHERLEASTRMEEDGGTTSYSSDDASGEEGWRNADGEKLTDFGVDEVVEFYDEDDVPLSELLRRRNGTAKTK